MPGAGWATLDGLTRLAIADCPSIKKMACFREITPPTTTGRQQEGHNGVHARSRRPLLRS